MEVLRPYTEFSPGDLAIQLYLQVLASEQWLRARGMGDILRSFGESTTLDTIRTMVEKGQQEHDARNPLHYAVMDKFGDVRGTASIYSGYKLPLYRLHVLLPPAVAPWPLRTRQREAAYNIAAWISGDPNNDAQVELLKRSYRELANYAGRLVSHPMDEQVWSIEPVRSPQGVHEAIASSGLHRVAEGRFDDGSSRHAIPVRSILYEDEPFTRPVLRLLPATS